MQETIDSSEQPTWFREEEHPKYPRCDWRYEAGNGDTQLGYWEWVAHQLESNDEPVEERDTPDPVALVIQQGGASNEWYPSLYNTEKDAEEAIIMHEKASYRAFGTFIIPPTLGKVINSDSKAETEFLTLIKTILTETER